MDSYGNFYLGEIMSTKTLTQIRETNRLIESILESDDGLITPEIEAMMNEVALAEPEKIDSYYHIMKRIEAEESYLKDREAELRSARKALENNRERLKNNLKFHMEQTQQTEVSGNEYRFKLAGSKPRLVIDESKVPDQYKVEVIERVIQKDRIKEDLDMGIAVEGASLEASYSLRPYPVAKAIASKKGA